MGKSGGTRGRYVTPRRSERFMTSSLSSPLGRVLDVSEHGFRLSIDKKPPFKPGETHEIVLRAGAQQVRALACVQWIKRFGLIKPRFEIGFAVVDQRAGVGQVVLQLGQFGCVDANAVNTKTNTGSAASAKRNAAPAADSGEPSVEMVDLYAILGVEPDAEAEDIRQAFRSLALSHHPDHSDAPDAVERFEQISSAYSVLRDPQRRSWYDEMRKPSAA